tara:strand:- start:109 stop:894 length:786 start_codon:yes stop_codon:yes gene_type:complete
MGYDITVKETKFHRWFSVWNWHRCIASAIYGAGGLSDDEYKDELYAVTDLQQNGLPKDEDGEKVSMADIETKVQTKNVEKVIVECKIQYDDELRAIGAAALIPVPKRMAEGKDFDEKQFAEMIGGTVAIQVRTNNLLHDHKEGMKMTNRQCQQLSSMDGEDIDSEVAMVLAVGLGSCLEKIGATDQSMRGAWEAMFEDMGMPAKVQENLFEPILQVFDESSKHKLNFEISEYMEGDQMMSLASAVAIMIESFLSGSPITIE